MKTELLISKLSFVESCHDASSIYHVAGRHCNDFLRTTVSVLEIVLVGQCEVFVCLDFLLTFFCSPWPRSSWVREWGLNSLIKMSIFPLPFPLKRNLLRSYSASSVVD